MEVSRAGSRRGEKLEAALEDAAGDGAGIGPVLACLNLIPESLNLLSAGFWSPLSGETGTGEFTGTPGRAHQIVPRTRQDHTRASSRLGDVGHNALRWH